MDKKLTQAAKNRRLTRAYHKINEEGRRMLDKFVQKLAKTPKKPAEMHKEQ
jgi:hypothetical protein